MKSIITLVILSLMFISYAGLIKLSARLLRRSIVSWKNCFLFSLIFVGISMIFRIILISANVAIPVSVAVMNGFITQLAIGAWFFRNRGTDSTGNALGWRGAMKLMGISYGILASTVIVLLGFFYFAKSG